MCCPRPYDYENPHISVTYDYENCDKLEILADILTHEYLPAIKELAISSCPRLNWQSGMMLPSSIQSLQLFDSGNISRSCLVSHTSTSLQELSG